MALPLLSRLSPRARRASPIIRRGVREGVSSRELTRVLQQAGLGIRRQVLLDIMRAMSDEAAIGPVLSALGIGRMPNPLRLPPAITKIRRAFSFTVRVRGLETDTGLTAEQFVQVTTDTLLTRGEIEALAQQAIETDLNRYKLTVSAVQLMGGVRAGAPGVL
jgi:hypothetical protein